MVDIQTDYVPFKGWVTTYNFKYKFRGMPYLVCDQFGNFFILPHCPHKRTIPFKKLDSSKGFVCYHGNKIRLTTLRKRAIIENNNYEIFC